MTFNPDNPNEHEEFKEKQQMEFSKNGETFKELHKIELADDNFIKDGLRIRVVKLYWDEKNYTCLKVGQLLKILKLWIIGEEERYPKEKGYRGRWMLFDEIKKVFEGTK